MNKEFIAEIANLLEVDENLLTPDFNLTESENWDSLTFVSIITLAEEYAKADIETTELSSVKTFADLLTLIEKSEKHK